VEWPQQEDAFEGDRDRDLRLAASTAAAAPVLGVVVVVVAAPVALPAEMKAVARFEDVDIGAEALEEPAVSDHPLCKDVCIGWDVDTGALVDIATQWIVPYGSQGTSDPVPGYAYGAGSSWSTGAACSKFLRSCCSPTKLAAPQAMIICTPPVPSVAFRMHLVHR
jgi:hypothetical protein